MWYERDVDAIMNRTRGRPLPRGRIQPDEALAFGIILTLFSVMLLGMATNWVAAFWLAFANFFYVFIYTIWLKRRTPQNIVIGGAAGAFPPVIGWAAATGSTPLEPWLLFALIFFWTPPHTWALAMRYKEDYKAAGVPMLPVIATEERVTRQMLFYTWATVVTSLVLIPATSWIYLAISVLGGGWFLSRVHKLYSETRAGAEVAPLKVFLQSNEYLAILFCGLAIDAVVNMKTIADFF